MPAAPIPAGYHTVTPYLIVSDPLALFAFLAAAFGATEKRRTPRPGGGVLNLEARIGDSMVMLVEARADHEARPASLYLYLAEVDAVYARAVAAGGHSLMEPTDMFYGERSAGVADPAGNHWYLSTRTEDLTSEQLAAMTETA